MQRLTRQAFIDKANKVHNGLYSYPDFEFKNTKTKVPIYCNKHKGIFWQTPKMHLVGHGCPQCGRYSLNRYKEKNQEYIDGEIWKDIKGFENIYKISNKGRLASLKGGFRILSNTNQKGDYFTVILRKGNECKSTRIHRLVYETFIGNIPKGYYIHHEDGNKQNNNVTNLRLVSPKEHAKEHYIENLIRIGSDISKTSNSYRYEIKDGEVIGVNKNYSSNAKTQYTSDGRIINAKHKPVEQYTKQGEFIKRYETISDASIVTGICERTIAHVCNGDTNGKGNKYKSAGGYIWKFAV